MSINDKLLRFYFSVKIYYTITTVVYFLGVRVTIYIHKCKGGMYFLLRVSHTNTIDLDSFDSHSSDSANYLLCFLPIPLWCLRKIWYVKKVSDETKNSKVLKIF